MADPFLGATENFFNPLAEDEGGRDSDEELGLRRVPAPIRRQGVRRFQTGDDWLVDEDAVLEQCMHNPDQKPKELVRFFFEVDFTDKEVLDRLPKSLQSDPAACARVCKMVRWHVTKRLQEPDLKFFIEEKIPEDFEQDGKAYALSYYILPPRRPAPVKMRAPQDKSGNFAANMEAEPLATRVAIANIAILFVGFSLALVGVSCDTTECRRADNIGQFITALAALSLAVVASYMSFLVANHS